MVKNKPSGYWTYERCLYCSKKCKTREEFNRKFPVAYTKASLMGWLNDICSHMISMRLSIEYCKDKWNCHVLAIISGTRTEFHNHFTKAYIYSRNNGWLDEFFPESSIIDKLDFVSARTIVRSFGFNNQEEYFKWSKTYRPPNVPGDPSKVYKGSGWISWGDYLGNGNVLKKDFLSYDECKSLCMDNGINSSAEYIIWRKMNTTNKKIPSYPPYAYRECWIDWGSFLNTNNKGSGASVEDRRDLFLFNAIKIHGPRYNYDESDFINQQTKINIYCNNCDKYFTQTPNLHTSQMQGCPRCSTGRSKGELVVGNIIQDISVDFDVQKSFPSLMNKKHLRYDFYLPEYNMCIEFDGEQHFTCRFNGWFSKDSIKDTQYRDHIKNQYCRDNRIKLIRIPYTMIDDIEHIISREFLKGFPRSINYSAKLLS